MNVNIVVNWNTTLIESKINSLITDDVLLQIQTLFAKTIEPWTPYWHGDLSTDITIDKLRYLLISLLIILLLSLLLYQNKGNNTI